MYDERFVRREYKYYVPFTRVSALRDRLLAHMEYDPFCEEMPEKMYTVRSIYYDTPHLLFYHEKLDGVKYRKKFRIRTYNRPTENTPAFFEIKRKVDDCIFKDRTMMPMECVDHVLETGEMPNGNHSTKPSKTSLNKFMYLFYRYQLRPRVLVTYEREAFVGMYNPDVRVTFDMNVRGLGSPTMDEIFRESDLKTFSDPNFVLEIKFYNQMPRWARQIVHDFRLRREAVSKYCNCLEVWHPSLRRLTNQL